MDCALLPNSAPTPAAMIELPAVESLPPVFRRLLLVVFRSLLFNGVVELVLTVVGSPGTTAVEVVTDGEASEATGAVPSETLTASEPVEDDPEWFMSEEFPLLLLVVFIELFGDNKLVLLLLVVLVGSCEERWYICICTRWMRSDSVCRVWSEELILASRAWTSPKR